MSYHTIIEQRQYCSQVPSEGSAWFSLEMTVELQKKVHPKIRNHGEGPYEGLLLVESVY